MKKWLKILLTILGFILLIYVTAYGISSYIIDCKQVLIDNGYVGSLDCVEWCNRR